MNAPDGHPDAGGHGVQAAAEAGVGAAPLESEAQRRYSRQILFAPLGPEGQRRLMGGRAALVGCGALGSVQAELLTRAGIGTLRLIDRDFVELDNLHRQTLYDEDDARQSWPKAVAAEAHLRRINAQVRIEARVDDLTPRNAAELLEGCDIVLDGTDNFETRYLINDFAVSRGIPWIYGAVVGSEGVSLTILPGEIACLECVFGPRPQAPAATCDTVGVLNWAVNWVASQQAGEAVKWLAGAQSAMRRGLIRADLWTNRWQQLQPMPPDPECRACGRRDFIHLRGETRAEVTLCGRNAVQIHERRRELDLAELNRLLSPHGTVHGNDYVLRFRPHLHAGGEEAALEMTIFPDGRALIKGTTDPAQARSLYARYLGS